MLHQSMCTLVSFNPTAVLNGLPECATMWLEGGLLAKLSEVLWKVCSPKRVPYCLGEAATGV